MCTLHKCIKFSELGSAHGLVPREYIHMHGDERAPCGKTVLPLRRRRRLFVCGGLFVQWKKKKKSAGCLLLKADGRKKERKEGTADFPRPIP